MKIAYLTCGCICLLDDALDVDNPKYGQMISIFTACSRPESAYKSEFCVVPDSSLAENAAKIERVYTFSEAAGMGAAVGLNKKLWEADKFRRVKELLR